MKKIVFILIFFSAILFAENTNSEMDGMALYKQKCAHCHGVNGEKKAFGRSIEIAQIDKEAFVFMLKGYRDKTYGGDIKYFMSHFVKNLTDDQIENLYVF